MTDRDFSEFRAYAANFYNHNSNYRQFLGYDSSRSSDTINYHRFFSLFVTFDLVFISLLWIICVMITGDNIYNALRTQVLHYTIYTSLFDIVVAALFRFLILILFYGIFKQQHWIIIALCTSGSCAFLISKVFYYDWSHTQQPVFEVLLVITSFVLSWGEAWFLDCRVIPQERQSNFGTNTNVTDRSPLLAPFLTSVHAGQAESIGNFYSPIDSFHNSDDEDEQNDEYKRMGIECVKKAYDLLESKDWKIEKVTKKNDTIQSTQRDKIGKIYRLTGKVHCPAELLLEDLFYKIEDIPKWNPTLLESKILQKIDPYTDITYQATVNAGGGIIKSRDFVNLRCWQYYKDGIPVEDFILNKTTLIYSPGGILTPVKEQSEDSTEDDDRDVEIDVDVDLDDDDECIIKNDNSFIKNNKIKKSVSEATLNDGIGKESSVITLSKSLGAKDFNDPDRYLSDDDDIIFSDAQDQVNVAQNTNSNCNDLFISAAMSINYPGIISNKKYIRGENLVSCFVMRKINGQPDFCIFEWLLCLDLKGYFPKYILETAYTTLMQDYMKYLRDYSNEIRNKGKVPKHIKI